MAGIGGGQQLGMDNKADFFDAERVVTFSVSAGSVVNPGRFAMSFGSMSSNRVASRLSVVTAYIAIAFVGAIVLRLF